MTRAPAMPEPTLVPEDTGPAAGQVLVADDQPDVLEALRLLLKLNGYAVRGAASPAAVVSALQESSFDLLVMDLNYARDTTSGQEGLDLVEHVRALDPTLPIVVMTAWSTVPLAVATMRRGVSDFVEKPWDNARLLAAVRAQVAAGRRARRDARLESDARDVQRRLLARPAPRVPGYDVGVAWRFAERLGGDAYEIAPLPGERLAVAIADVCGKGTPAALLMASAQATLRDLVALPLAPAEVCARLDHDLSTRLAPDRFVSLAFAVLDARGGSLAYTNAGHPPPLLLGGDGSVRRLERGGPVLGIVDGARYETDTVSLRGGDRLVLYTDGVVEASAAARGEMGDARLLDGIRRMRGMAPSDAAGALLAMAEDFAGGGALADDATVVIVDVTGGSPR
jgi:sigma-B regulation protein RsbU (phosphoserine phosphatase)